MQVGAFVHNLTSKPGYARRTSPLCHRKLDSSKAQRAMIHCSGNACLLFSTDRTTLSKTLLVFLSVPLTKPY